MGILNTRAQDTTAAVVDTLFTEPEAADTIPDTLVVDSIAVKVKSSYASPAPDTVIFVKRSGRYIPDTLFLLSGDRITGRILSFEKGRFSIDAQATGVASVKWNKIRTIKGGSRNFKVEDTRGEIFIGKIRAAKDSGDIVIQSNLKYGLRLEDVVRIYPMEKKWYRGFKGNLGAGVSYTKSSDVLRLNAEYNINYVVSKWRFVNNLSYIETITNKDEHSVNNTVNLQALYTLPYKWVLSEINSFNRNDELGIRARWSIGVGGGNSIVQTEMQRLMILTGLMQNSERDIESDDLSSNLEWPVTLEHAIFSFLNPNLSTSVSATSYVGLTEKGRFRLDTNADITWEFINNFNLSFSVYYSYDNKTLVGKDTKEDYGTVLSLLLDLR